jgi:hypothetical protein
MLETQSNRCRRVRQYYAFQKYAVLYGCETWSLTLQEEHRFRVFENRMLRNIFGSEREKVAGDWKRLHDEELHNLYISPCSIGMIKLRKMRCAGHVAHLCV